MTAQRDDSCGRHRRAHLPGLAVAHALRARGIDVAGSVPTAAWKRAWCPQHDIAIDTIAVKGLRGKGIATLLCAPVRVLSAFAPRPAW